MNTQASEIRSANRIRIARYLLEKGETSKADIAVSLHLSMPTTLTGIKELTELGLVVESGIYASTGGRKARALSINPDGAYAVGVEIHSNSIQLVLTNLKQELVADKKAALSFTNTPGYDFDLYQQIRDFLQETGVSPERVSGVGLALPGSVDSERCLLLQSYELHISERSFASLATLLSSSPAQESASDIPSLSCPLTLENASNAALLSESGRKNDNLLLFSLDETPDGAVRMNGRIYRGDHGRGGNFGHMMIKRGGRECYCGREGCAAAYLSARVLEKISNGSLEDFFAGVARKDSACAKAWNKYQDNLMTAILNLRAIYDCEIILAGSVSTYLDEYAPDLTRQLRKANKAENEKKYVYTAQYADRAAAYGISRKLMEDRLLHSIV